MLALSTRPGAWLRKGYYGGLPWSRRLSQAGHWLGLVTGVCVQAQFATAVLDYAPGTGYATEFGTGLGYTLPASVIGEPSRVTPGEFGGPVDPFSAPYLREQLLSIGSGGSLTVALSARNDDANPHGIDFQIFGGAFFVVINGDYSGGGITDGSIFGGNPGQTRVSVSTDGLTYYVLDPGRAPVVDGLYPTRGAGDFQVPVDPRLQAADFAGLDLAGIGMKYQLSGGGTGYDLDWARKEDGTPAGLAEIRYVRIDVLTGRSDVDALAAVRAVPEPSISVLLICGLAGALTFGTAIHRKGR